MSRFASGRFSETGWVAGGLAVLGLSSYGYLAAAAHAVAAADFARLGVTWTVVYTLSAGAFAPLEQALTVRLAQPTGHARRHFVAVTLGCGLVPALAAILLALLLPVGLKDHLWGTHSGLLWPLLAAVASLVPLHGVRGVLAGNRQFRAYGCMLGADGLLKLSASTALALFGIRSVAAYAWILCAVHLSVAAAAAMFRRQSITIGYSERAPRGAWRAVAGGIAWLTAWTLCAQVLLNSGVVLTKLGTVADAPQAGGFLTALILSRIPLFFAGAILSPFLRAASAAAAHRDLIAVRRMLRQVSLRVAVACSGCVVLITLLGPIVSRLLFPMREVPGGLIYCVLGLGSSAFFVATLYTQVLLSTGRARIAAARWFAALVIGITVTMLPISPATQAATGLVVGAMVALVTLTRALPFGHGSGRPELRSGTARTADDRASGQRPVSAR